MTVGTGINARSVLGDRLGKTSLRRSASRIRAIPVALTSLRYDRSIPPNQTLGPRTEIRIRVHMRAGCAHELAFG